MLIKLKITFFHKFTSDCILNLDEFGIIKIVQAPYVIAKCTQKQVCPNIVKNSIPPVFIFFRARVH